MLDSKYNRLQRKSDEDIRITRYRDSGLVAYKFHTAILAVNSTIRKEAEELMYKRNVFVVLSYQWPSQSLCGAFGGMLLVPVVSTKHVNRMQLHSLRIHHSFGPSQTPNTPVKSCIMLAKDLDAFSCATRAATERHQGPAVKLKFLSGFLTLEFSDVEYAKGAGKILFDLRNTGYRSMDETLQHFLLEPLASMTCLGQRVVVKGAICNAHETAHLKQLMSPGLVSNEATFLSFVQTLMKLKDIANSYVGHDELDFVVIMYEFIAQRYAAAMMERHMVSWAMATCPTLLEALDMLGWETSINIACAKLRMQELDDFGSWVNAACHIFGYLRKDRLGPEWVLPPGIIDYHHIIGVWWTIYHGDCKRDFGEPSPWNVGQEVRAIERLNGFPHLVHDLEILKSYPDQEATFSAEVLPLDRCSVSQLPFPAMSFYKDIESLKEYTKVRGWHDIGDFKSLSDNMKAAIKGLQRQRGLQVTDFNLIYVDFDQGHKVEES